MKISVIIPTYEGKDRLTNTLESLKYQSYKNFEVVLVVDGSTDGTASYFRMQPYPFPINVIEQKNQGRAGARNTGAENALGQLLVFFDDDVTIDRDCLKYHDTLHNGYHEAIAVGSIKTDLAGGDDFSRYKEHLSIKWMSMVPTEQPLGKEHLFLSAANFSIKKTLFRRLKGFDRRLKDAEDLEFAIRAYIERVSVIYIPSALVFHKEKNSFFEYIKRLNQYRKAHFDMIEVNPSTRNFFDIEKYSVKQFSLKGVFYSLFRGNALVLLIESPFFRNFLPKPMRFKIYDWITVSRSVYFPCPTE